ncbi:MAG: succinylglutamate desuccinylase, partial [Pseudomonadota bacterium]|nr:succinylglutamate desuccinylase [Pseudomonadota bacterium]
MTLSPQLTAFARGDFSALVTPFRAAGFDVCLPAAGVVQLLREPAARSVLISVGIHGDETAPIELVAQLLQQLCETPSRLQVNLMLVVGNMDAIASARRFIDVDLNRLFRAEQGDMADTAEALRARAVMAASANFFSTARSARWHLDLHTAIRASVYPTFAIVPAVIERADKLALLRLLADGGIAAAIINPTSAGTFSAFTAQELGATSATVELGQVGQLGQNDVSAFAAMGDAVMALLGAGSKSALDLSASRGE